MMKISTSGSSLLNLFLMVGCAAVGRHASIRFIFINYWNYFWRERRDVLLHSV